MVVTAALKEALAERLERGLRPVVGTSFIFRLSFFMPSSYNMEPSKQQDVTRNSSPWGDHSRQNHKNLLQPNLPTSSHSNRHLES